VIEQITGGAGKRTPSWIDVCDPTPDEIAALIGEHGLPEAALQACLDPLHLPKHERLGDTTFMILRFYDESAKPEENSFQRLTRKIALFLSKDTLITIHRKKSTFVDAIRAEYEAEEKAGRAAEISLQVVLLEILLASVDSFHAPLEDAEEHIHELEAYALSAERTTLAWRDVFRTKVRTQTVKRLLWHTQNAVQKFVPQSTSHLPLAQDARERIASLSFLAESLDDDLDNLLNIQLSLAANRTNDVMRALTIFSAFFLPITFIVGVYGMNFRHMPELGWRYGYPMALMVIVITIVVVALWVRHKGWHHD
jgi:magnesium transporter